MALERAVGYTLDRSPVTGPTYRDRQLTLTPTGNLESPINLHPFGLWEEAGVNPAGTRRTCKLHTEGPQLASGFKPKTLLL